MPENFLIVPSADITNGRINTLANTIVTTELTVGSLQNDVELVVYQVSSGVVGTPQAAVAETHVFALVGQSNMIGRPTFDGGAKWPENTYQIARGGSVSGGAEGALVPAQHPNDGPAVSRPLDHVNPQSGDMGLDVQFAIDYLAAHPGVTLVFIPCAQGGTGFSTSHWNKGNPSYENAVSRINAAMAAHPSFHLRGFLWHQGEADASIPETYAGLLDQMIEDMRTDVAVADATTPFVLGGLGPTTAEKNAMTAIIADTTNRLGHTAFADTSDLVLQDAHHFDAASLRLLGGRYNNALASAIANTPDTATTIPGAPSGLTAVAGDTQITLNWSPPNSTGGAAITDYRIERSTGGAFTVITDGISPTTGYSDTGLNNGTAYTYRVSAINTAGTGAASGTTTATPQAAPTGDPLVEPGAVAHWLFGDDNPTYADLVSGQVASGPAHALSAGYITSPGGRMQGLDSGIPEADAQTMCFVFRLAGAANSIIGGTLMTGGDDGSTGVSPFTASLSAIRVNMRGGWGNQTLSDTAATSPDFVFVAVSKNATSGTYLLFAGLQGGNEVLSGTSSQSTSPRTLSIGNLHYDSDNLSGQISIAEATIFDASLTAAELDAVYQRSRTRLANRGLVLR